MFWLFLLEDSNHLQLIKGLPKYTIPRRYIIKQIINGIAELHQCGWVHMEINAKGIIIIKEGLDTYKISLWESFMEIWNEQIGYEYYNLLEYLEIQEKHRNIQMNQQIDLWAFGLIVLYLYTGEVIIVYNKYQLTEEDYQLVQSKIIVNKLNLDPDVYSMFLQIFDKNSKITAAEMNKNFQIQGEILNDTAGPNQEIKEYLGSIFITKLKTT